MLENVITRTFGYQRSELVKMDWTRLNTEHMLLMSQVKNFQTFKYNRCDTLDGLT